MALMIVGVWAAPASMPISQPLSTRAASSSAVLSFALYSSL